jgi:hypothetical protein
MTTITFDWPTTFTRSSRRRFIAQVHKAAKHHQLKFEGEVPLLTLQNGAVMNLCNLINECAAMPETNWPHRIEQWFVVITTSMKLTAAGDGISPEVAKASLRVRLLPDGLPEYCVTRPSFPGLVAALMIVRTGYGQHVIEENLETWGLDREEAFATALLNTLEHEKVQHFSRGPMSAIDGGSNYASTHALFQRPEKPYILGIPTRNFVVGQELEHLGEAIAYVMMETLLRYNEGPGSTTNTIWFVDPETVGIWGEGAELVDVRIWTDRYGQPDCKINNGPRLDQYLDYLAARAQHPSSS